MILCVDFNSRTGRAPDYDIKINVLNERYNEDGVINKYGRSLLMFCINTELKIGNGRMFDDKGIGRYTNYSPMGASTIDYVLLRDDYMIGKFKFTENSRIGSLSYKIPYSQFKIERVGLYRNIHT